MQGALYATGVLVAPRRTEVVPPALGSKCNAVPFPIVLNPNDPHDAERIVCNGPLKKEVDDRSSVENLLRDALQEIVTEPPDPRIGRRIGAGASRSLRTWMVPLQRQGRERLPSPSAWRGSH